MDRVNDRAGARRSWAVLDWIYSAIRSGSLRAGARLPTERELAEYCGVSRASVREALSILGALNIVDRRVGDGTYLTSHDEHVLSLTLELARGEPSLADILELQRVLEVGVADIAARAMTADQLRAVENALAEMEKAAAEGDSNAYFAADRRFHRSIATATRNTLLEQQVECLISHMDRPLWRCVKIYFIRNRGDYIRNSIDDHRRLVAAFRNHDPSEARRVMEEHFARIRQEILGG